MVKNTRSDIRLGQEAAGWQTLRARSWIPGSQGQGRPRIPCLEEFFASNSSQNEACQSQILGFYEAIMVITVNLPCVVFKGAIKWEEPGIFSFLIK